jgi:hypothetical protein
VKKTVATGAVTQVGVIVGPKLPYKLTLENAQQVASGALYFGNAFWKKIDWSAVFAIAQSTS